MEHGQHVTAEGRMHMSTAAMGRIESPEWRQKQSVAGMGRIVSPETGAKISAAKIGHLVSAEVRAKIRNKRIGHKDSAETIAKRSASLWKGGRPVSIAKSNGKRRGLGFVPINSSFIGADAHHMDKVHVVYIPHDMHYSVRHDIWTGRNMDKINALAIQFLATSQT